MAVTAESHTGSSFKSPEAFRTISEVSGDLNLPQHVLRFWETRFAQIKPMKRGGGRRLYRPDHVALLRGIKALLYDDGMTIKGVQKVLREKGTKTVIARGSANVELTLESAALPPDASERLSALKDRVEAERTVEAADSVEAVNPDKIRASISRFRVVFGGLRAALRRSYPGPAPALLKSLISIALGVGHAITAPPLSGRSAAW
jgi:DNA-binding transcriptional MerR regulator